MVYHEQAAKYDLWVWLIIVPIILGLIITGVWFLTYPPEAVEQPEAGAIVFLASAALTAIICWIALPRSYQILDDRVKVILGGPFSFNIPFKSIKEVVYPVKSPIFVISLGFAGSLSSKHCVLIDRGSHGMKVMIAPKNAPLFVENLRKTILESGQWS